MKELTPADFQKLYKDSIELYSNSIWALADLLYIAKEKFGRQRVIDMIDLPSNKIDWLICIASIKHRNSTLPEVHYEVVGLKDYRKWLNKAKKENLTPTQLRKKIRSANSAFNKPKEIKMNQWARKLMLAENEIKRLDNTSGVKNRLRSLVALYESLED